VKNTHITRAPLFLALIFVMPSASSAEPQTKLEQKTTTYSVGLSATRLIYTPGSTGVSVTINNPNDFPVLAQSEVSPDDGGSRVPFSVTPPLFRLDAGQQSRVRIIMTGDSSPKDRESLNWFCVTGIPPEKGDAWDERKDAKNGSATLDVKVKLRQCIKLLTRPAGLSSTPEAASSELTWYRDAKGVRAMNNSPYFINLKTISVGGKSIDAPDYIAPFSSRIYTVSGGTGPASELKFVVINDLGGDSAQVTARIQ